MLRKRRLPSPAALWVPCGTLAGSRSGWGRSAGGRPRALDANRPTHQLLSDDPRYADDPELRSLRLQVHDALQLLEETLREIVVLHYFSGLSYQEIGQTLDLSVQSVHGRLQRARSKLAQLLDTRDSSGAKP